MMQILGLDTSSFAAEVADMTIQSALVANSSNNREQLLRTSAQFDATERSATCTFSSVDVRLLPPSDKGVTDNPCVGHRSSNRTTLSLFGPAVRRDPDPRSSRRSSLQC